MGDDLRCLAAIIAGLSGSDGVANDALAAEIIMEGLPAAGSDVGGGDQEVRVRDALAWAEECRNSGRLAVELLVAVQDLRERSSDEALGTILAALIRYALRDDRFEAREARLIGAIRRAWGAEVEESQWTVFGSDGSAGTDWTPVHDLALVYLYVAHQSDGELDRSEVDAITRKLGEWLPSALPSEVLNVVDEALRKYADGELGELLEQSVERMVAIVPVHQREVVIKDLIFVAEADNRMLVEEKRLIAEIASRWGIELDDG